MGGEIPGTDGEGVVFECPPLVYKKVLYLVGDRHRAKYSFDL